MSGGPTCLNCQTSLATEHEFCPRCGQRHGEPVDDVRTLLRHFFDDVFSLDSKIARTLGLLVGRPGRLTREYIQGRQVAYVRPLRLYLVTSLVFFLAISWIDRDGFVSDGSGQRSAFSFSLNDGTTTTIDSRPDSTATHDVGRALSRAQLDDVVREQLETAFRDAEFDSSWTAGVAPRGERDEGQVAGLRDIPIIGNHVADRVLHVMSLDSEEFKGLFNARMRANLPKGVFVLVPVFALVLRLFYVRRDFLYATHFVFALHVHAFAFLVLLLLNLSPTPWIDGPLLLWLLVYVFVAMRRVYGQGIFKTLVKYSGSMLTYGVLLMLTVVGTAAVSVLTL